MASSVMYCCSILFLKLSIGVLFLRFIISPWQRRLVYAVMITSSFVNIVYAIWIVFNCGIPHNHNPNTRRNCPSAHTSLGVSIAQAAVNATTDITLTIMPVPLLWGSTMKLREKISVCFILTLATGYVLLKYLLD